MYKKINLEKLVVYDIETGINYIIFCFYDIATTKKTSFVFYDDIESITKLYAFLKNCASHGYSFIGYNVLSFDSQILQYFLDTFHVLYEGGLNYTIDSLYKKAQSLIISRNPFELIREDELTIPHIDLFIQLGYDKPSKMTSLKWVEFSLRRKNIKEMPYNHDYNVSDSELKEVIDYCWEDVDATLDLFEHSKNETVLRLNLSQKYNLNLINASETKISKDIFAQSFCKELQITNKELRELKTYRQSIKLKDIIFDYISFFTEELKNILENVKQVIIDDENKSFSKSFTYHNLPIDIGLGGIHGCVPSGVYTHEEDESIVDLDVTSMYPQIAIQNGLTPEHLGDVFTKVYTNMFNERQKYPKSDPSNYVLKICLNSVYGLSSEPNSFFFDRKYTFATTVNGQMMLLMFAEALRLGIGEEIKFLQFNTDGITFIIKKNKEEKLQKIISWWENTTRLKLERAEYKQMIIRDVNNYIAEYSNGKLKQKGIFEIDMPIHKNTSMLVVSKALTEHFINNKEPEDYIRNNNDIFDFCIGIKKKSNFKINLLQIFDSSKLITEQQKVCRFIVANRNPKSGKLFKDFNDGKKVGVMINTFSEPLDTITDKETKNYDINYDFYIRETKKIIELIKPSVVQSSLF